MTYRLLDCYPGCGIAYAASRTPAVVYTARRSEMDDPTAPILEANRPLIGGTWGHQIAPPHLWLGRDVDIVAGSPADTRGHARRRDFLRFATGIGAPIVIADCSWLVGNTAADVAEMAAVVAEVPGRRYLVTVVPYDEHALGAARQRQRCAVVASQVAFGVERPPRGLSWPVAPWGRVKRGRGAALTPAMRGYGPDWAWPGAPDLVGMSAWAARWLLEWAVESLSARPGGLRGERGPDGVRVIRGMSRIR